MNFLAGIILGITAGAAATAIVCYITRGQYVNYLERGLWQSAAKLAEREHQLRELTADDAHWWKTVNAELHHQKRNTNAKRWDR